MEEDVALAMTIAADATFLVILIVTVATVATAVQTVAVAAMGLSAVVKVLIRASGQGVILWAAAVKGLVHFVRAVETAALPLGIAQNVLVRAAIAVHVTVLVRLSLCH